MRVVRGCGALVVLVGAVVGLPVALALLGGNPLPDQVTLAGLQRLLLTPAPERVFIGLVVLVGWVAWALFTLSVVVEVVNAASGFRLTVRLPRGLAIGQRAAAVLVLTVVAMIATPPAIATPTPTPAEPAAAPPGLVATPTHTSPGPVIGRPTPVDAAPTGHDREAADAAAGDRTPSNPGTATTVRGGAATHAATADLRRVHTVVRGDVLWGLADEYLGDGTRWREIAAANPGIDPDHLAVGQKLTIPAGPADTAGRVGAGSGGSVEVEQGDSLSSIADDLYGSTAKWSTLWEANRDQIDDPDLIHPGQDLTLPLAPTEPSPDHRVRPTTQDGAADSAPDDRGHGRPTTPEGAPDEVAGGGPAVADGRGDQAGGPGGAAPDRDADQDAEPEVPTAAPTPAAPATAPPTDQPVLPSSAGSSTGQAAPPGPTSDTGGGQRSAETDAPTVAAAAAASGLLMTVGLLGAVRLRRRRQLQARRPGRRVPTPTPTAQHLQADLAVQGEPLRVEQLDTVLRAISAHHHQEGLALPTLSAVRVADRRIDLLLQSPATAPPPGIDDATAGVWTIHADRLDTLLAIPGTADAPPPWPALVTIGRDAETAHLLLNLETAAALTLTADDPERARAMLTAVTLELAVSPWAADLNVTLVGDVCPGLPDVLDDPTVTHVDDVDRVIDGLEVRAAQQRAHLHDSTLGQKRADPELADAWCPHVVLIGRPLDPEQADRLRRVVDDLPRVAIAAVTTTTPAITDWQFTITDGGDRADLQPHGWTVTPQLVDSARYEAALALLAAATTDETLPAPWWDHETRHAGTVTRLHRDQPPDPVPDADPSDAGEPTAAPDPDAAGRHHLDGRHVDGIRRSDEVAGAGPARRSLSLAGLVTSPELTRWTEPGERLDPDQLRDGPAEHPFLRILGRPDIDAAQGVPNRNRQRCLEVMLYLLEHPVGTTNRHLADGLCLSRETAKSVVAYLRKWLGVDAAGAAYLPEFAVHGFYRLDDRVTSDWHRARQLGGRGINTAADENLVRILHLVRGPVLDGTGPWLAAETLRPDITSMVVDTAHTLAGRAVTVGDVHLARWAVGRGLLVHPDSEVLLTDLVQTERRAGNRPEVERLANRIGANARSLGIDLADDTIEVLRAAL